MKMMVKRFVFINQCRIGTFVLFLLFASSLNAQRPDLSVSSTGSTVNVLAKDNDYLYVGGLYASFGTNTGGAAKVTTASHTYDACMARVAGIIYCAIPDGSGGWYVGGTFTRVGQVTRNNIAHILSNGTLDNTWNPDANGLVYTLVMNGSDIYAGGDFTTIGGATRNRIAKLNNTNGNADATWNPNAGSTVRAIAISGSDIYAGGAFTTIGGSSRDYIAKLNNTTGTADASWNPSANALVACIAISGSDIYAGGAFTTIGGSSRNRIAKLDNTTGTADATWNANANSTVLALAITGSDIYAGGLFSSIGGSSRNYIAKLNNTTGTADATWNPTASNTVSTIAINGTDIYVGGDFSTVGSRTRNRIARLNNTTGEADASWDPNSSGSVLTIAINGSDVFIGGGIVSVNGTTRNRLARISRSTGELDATWNPNPDGEVNAIFVDGSDIYVGGKFNSIGGQSRSLLAKLNNTNGDADATWNPGMSGTVVNTIAISGNDMYIGGNFDKVSLTDFAFLAKLDKSTATLDPTWFPDPGAFIYSILIDGNDIYTSGLFLSIGGQSRFYLAKLNNTTGEADATWNASSNGVVWTLLLDGTDIYAGGLFTSIGGASRNRVARLNTTTAVADASWNPNVTGGSVNTISISGSDIYLGGQFTSVGGTGRNRIAKVNNTTGALDDTWNPDINNNVNAVVAIGTEVYAGGSFNTVGGYSTGRFTKLVSSVTATWAGTSSSDWIRPCNWSPAFVPSTTDVVILPSSTPYSPDMGGYDYTLNNLTIASGATLQTSTGSLTITGSLVNNGTINASTGKVILAGTSAQSLSGSGSIENLTLNNSAGASISSGQVNVTGTLTISSGTLTTGGLLTLKSSATGTARVAQSSGTISGNVTVERYIPAKTGRRWTFIACPVSGSTIRDGWQDDVFITGSGTGGTYCGTGTDKYNSNGFDAAQLSAASMYTYNVTPVSGTRWVSVPNTTSTYLTPGTGYRMNIRGPRGTSDANCQDQLNTLVPPSPLLTIMTATGTLTQGTTSVPIKGKTSYNAVSGTGNAYTLIGNPYACEIDLQSVYATNSASITSSFWFFTPVNSNATYSTYNAATQQALDFPSGYNNGSVSDVVIASGQAFFVERSGDADVNLTFQESHKSSTVLSGNIFYKTTAINNKIRVRLKSTTTADENSIYINYLDDPGASSNTITTFDSYSFNTGNPFYLVSQKSGRNLSIQTRATFNNNDTIPLSFKGEAGTYKLSFSEYEQFSSASEIKLLDAFLGSEINIRTQPEYSFTITANPLSYGANRFKIVFRSSGILPVSSIELSGIQKENTVQLDWYVLTEKDMNSYSIERSADGKNFSAIGKLAASYNNGSTAQYTFNDAKPLAGVSYYRIKAEGKQGDVYYSKIIKMQQGKSIALHVYPNPVSDKLNIVLSNATNDYSLRVINVFGQEVTRINNIKIVSGTVSIGTASLSKGVYTVQLINTKGDVISERFVKQ